MPQDHVDSQETRRHCTRYRQHQGRLWPSADGRAKKQRYLEKVSHPRRVSMREFGIPRTDCPSPT